MTGIMLVGADGQLGWEVVRRASVVLMEWNEFRAVVLKQLRQKMRGNVLVDLRNVYAPSVAEAAGFVYRGVGRGMHQAN